MKVRIKFNKNEVLVLNKETNRFEVDYICDISNPTKLRIKEQNRSLVSNVGLSKNMLDESLEDNLNVHTYVRESSIGKVYLERVQDRIISKDESIRINKNEEFKMIQDGAKLVSHNDINVKFEMNDSVNNHIESDIVKRNNNRRMSRKLKKQNRR